MRMSYGSILVFALLAGVVVVGGCSDGPPAPSVTAEQLEDGATTTLTGIVAGRIDDHSFSMRNEEGGEMLDTVIVSREPLAADVAGDTKVRVTGTVKKTTTAEIEKEIGWNFDVEVDKSFENIKAFVIADTVEPVQE